MITQKQCGALIAILGLGAIAAATLIPIEGVSVQRPQWCLICGTLGGVDFILNILLFIPYGMGLRWSGQPAWRAVAITLATTLAVETLQIAIIAGRDASLGDLVTNSLGGAFGVLLASRWRAWILPAPRQAWRLVLGGLVVWLTILGLTAWGLQLALPKTAYWGQWAPELGHMEHFEGAVLAASTDGVPLPPHRLPKSEGIRARLLRKGARVEAVIVPGAPTGGLAPIVSILDEEQMQILVLGQDGRDLVFRLRTRSRDARLQQPAARLRHAFARVDSTDTLRIFGERRGGELAVGMQVGEEGERSRGRAVVALSPSRGWELLWPFERPLGSEARLISAIWLAALLVPLGYWSARPSAGARHLAGSRVRSGSFPTAPGKATDPSRGATALELVMALVLALTLGLVALPALFHLAPPHWSEWLGSLAGLEGGWLMGRYVLRHERERNARQAPDC